MSHGPTLIYDKSAIQRLSVEEASWLTHFFRGVITPIYRLEVLGDLAKEAKRGTPQQFVAALAAKTTALGSLHNIPHTDLIEMEILGNPVEMRGVPIVGGGQQITASNGETGIFFDVSPEDRTLDRWGASSFQEEEHEQAKRYRTKAKGIDLQAFVKAAKAVRPKGAAMASSLTELLSVVDQVIDNPAAQFKTLDTALEIFDQSDVNRAHVKKHWIRYGRPAIRDFLPYMHHCLRVSMLFSFGVGMELISQRPTNAIDVMYLYYLPFCNVFTSADKLHTDLVPLFIGADQMFVPGDQIQAALRAHVAHYKQHEAELRRKGRANFAEYPPLEIETAIHSIYDRFMPHWREASLIPKEPISPEESARLMAKFRPMMDAIAKASKAQQEL